MNVREQVLITPAELARLAESGDPLRILDVRWRLDAPDGRPAYLDGHIPGAVYVSLEDELPTTPCPDAAAIRCRPVRASRKRCAGGEFARTN